MTSIKSMLLDRNDHYIIDFDFTCVLPTDEAAMLNYIIDLSDYKGSLNIKMTPSYIQRKRPKWTTYFIRKTLKNLTEVGIISEFNNDGRGKTYRLNKDAIYELLAEYEGTLNNQTTQNEQSDYSNKTVRLSNLDNQTIQNDQQSITNQEHNQEHNQSYVENDKSFIPQIEDVIDYLNDVTGQKLRSSSKGHKNYIRARLRDGYTVDDCKVVIDKKWADWQGTDWEKFMKPSTLFAPSHFDEYLNQPMKCKKRSAQSKLNQNKPEDYEFVGEIKL